MNGGTVRDSNHQGLRVPQSDAQDLVSLETRREIILKEMKATAHLDRMIRLQYDLPKS